VYMTGGVISNCSAISSSSTAHVRHLRSPHHTRAPHAATRTRVPNLMLPRVRPHTGVWRCAVCIQKRGHRVDRRADHWLHRFEQNIKRECYPTPPRCADPSSASSVCAASSATTSCACCEMLGSHVSAFLAVCAQAFGGALYAYSQVTIRTTDVQITGCTASGAESRIVRPPCTVAFNSRQPTTQSTFGI
jgi:hypothetical protein